MKIVAFDPYISVERGRQMNVDMLPLDQLVATSDFLTVHLPKNKETLGLINRDLLVKAKPSLRVINVARGGIVAEHDLFEALRDGLIAGAALDVFEREPVTDSPLFSLPNVVVTPHLGASTREAQDKAGDVIADMVQLALAGDFVPFAVNIDASDANETLRPFLPLAERLGQLFASLVGKTPTSLEISATGDIGGYDTRILTLSALKGFFASITGEQVTYVNAPQLAKDAGCEVRENNSPISTNADYVNLVTLKCDGHNIAATLVGPRREARLVLVDDHITGVLSEHQGGAFLDMKPAGIRVRGRRSTPGRYFQVANPGTGWGGTDIVDPLSIVEGWDPKVVWPGLRLLVTSTTGEHAAWYVLNEQLQAVQQDMPAAVRVIVERIGENCEPSLCSVMFLGGAGGSLRAGVTENPVLLTRAIKQALVNVTCGGAPAFVWPGGGITVMSDVLRMPDNSFGTVPTPAIIAPIEFSMRLSDYQALGGHMAYVRSLQDVLKQGSWHSDGAPTALSWQAQAQANPWPLGQDPMLG